MPVCTSIQDIQTATPSRTKGIYRTGRISSGHRAILANKNELAMIDGIVMKGKRIIIPFQLHKHKVQQLHRIYMEIEKTGLLAHKSVYWLNMNTGTDNTLKQCVTFLDYKNTQPQENHTTQASNQAMVKSWCGYIFDK